MAGLIYGNPGVLLPPGRPLVKRLPAQYARLLSATLLKWKKVRYQFLSLRQLRKMNKINTYLNLAKNSIKPALPGASDGRWQ